MKKNLSHQELTLHWQIWPQELNFINSKREKTKLRFALILKYFQIHGKFPTKTEDFPNGTINFIADQLKFKTSQIDDYNWNSRTIERHRSEIRDWLGFRQITNNDIGVLKDWLIKEIIPQGGKFEDFYEELHKECKKRKVEPPVTDHCARLIASCIQTFESKFTKQIYDKLNKNTRSLMDSIISTTHTEDELDWTTWQWIKSDPGKAGIANLKEVANRLQKVKSINIPDALFSAISQKLLELFAKRAAVEEPHELRRHQDQLRLTLLAIYLHRRKQELTDHLVDLFIETTHKMGKRAEKKIEDKMSGNFKKVPGKIGMLAKMAEASLNAPHGLVKEVIYPIASEKTLRALIEEIQKLGSGHQDNVRLTMQRSYKSHYRQMLPPLFESLEFRCTNPKQQPVLNAFDFVKKYFNQKCSVYPDDLDVPLEGVVKTVWMPLVLTEGRVSRSAYEICVLKALREKLRCREIWVVGSKRYRDPEEDLPQNFQENREKYFNSLGISSVFGEFTNGIRKKLFAALNKLNQDITSNPKVRLLYKKGGWISLSPFEPKPEPEHLGEMKQEILRRWPATTLLDVLKETDLRLNFSEFFQSATGQERLNTETLQRRILLCLYGLGTNTGIKSMSSNPTNDYKDLQYVRRRFLFADGVRQAITRVANATLATRHPHIWGDATTACASDSKQFGAWDQNLLTEWHMRYQGRGVMVYWHVEKKSVCVYSQFKRVSSSEVTAMIEGVLRHCTDVEISRQYVDSHGQNEIAFAFCNLLGFELMPRLKGIHKQKLYKAYGNMELENLEPILSPRSIDWDLIDQQLDALVKHAVALKMGMADAESLLRRFTKSNAVHPAYKAFAELGKAIKTIFLCNYLSSEELRQEIHEGLNVVESWNAANGFIFYGRAGEISTNHKEDQEISLLSLHLLQSSLVYVNTLMIQKVLNESDWMKRMTDRDLSALSPLFTQHINPYGKFDLDMNARIPIETSIEIAS